MSLPRVQLLVFLLVAIFIALSSIQTTQPGVNSDQLLFVNAAIGPLDQTWIYKHVRGFPIMIMAYMGALKSYIYKPIFLLFGVSVYSIRLPVILLTATGLFILFRHLRIINQKIALFSLILLISDASFIAFTRIDFGPVVLEFLLKVVSLLMLFYYFRTKKLKYLYLLLISLGLGLFNKANFIWFINALFVASFILYENVFFLKTRPFFKKTTILLIIPWLLALIYAIYVLIVSSNRYSVTAVSSSGELIIENINLVLRNLIGIINGSAMHYHIYGIPPHKFGWIFSIGFIIFNLIGVGYFTKNKPTIAKEIRHFYFFVLTIIFVLLVQLFATLNAVSPWHTFSIYPFLTILTAIFIYQLFSVSKTKRLALVILVGIFIYNLATYVSYIQAYSKPVKDLSWSNQFYDLVKYTDSYPGIVLTTDIVLQTNYLALSTYYKKYTPLEWLVDNSNYETYITNLQTYFDFKKDPDILVVVPNQELSTFDDTYRLFLKFTQEFGIKLTKLKEFSEGENVVYTVYKASK